MLRLLNSSMRCGFHLRGEDRDAVNLSLQHAADAGFHAYGIVVGVGDKDFLAVLDGDLFKTANEFGEKWVGDVGDNQAIEAAAAGAEGAGVVVGVELEFAMALRTRSAVSGATLSEPLMVRDTVAVETRATRATSRMFISLA